MPRRICIEYPEGSLSRHGARRPAGGDLRGRNEPALFPKLWMKPVGGPVAGTNAPMVHPVKLDLARALRISTPMTRAWIAERLCMDSASYSPSFSASIVRTAPQCTHSFFFLTHSSLDYKTRPHNPTKSSFVFGSWHSEKGSKHGQPFINNGDSGEYPRQNSEPSQSLKKERPDKESKKHR